MGIPAAKPLKPDAVPRGVHRIFQKGFPLKCRYISAYFMEPEMVLIIVKGA